jgi:hypothetical protein
MPGQSPEPRVEGIKATNAIHFHNLNIQKATGHYTYIKKRQQKKLRSAEMAHGCAPAAAPQASTLANAETEG